MASVTIQTHNVSVQATSGRSIFSLTLDQCTGYRAYASGGTLVFRTCELSQNGTTLVLEWNPNTSTVGIGTIVVVEAQVSGGAIVKDYMAFNQQGTQYNMSVSGSRDLEGDSGNTTYAIQTNVQGTFTVVSESTWLTVNGVTKTGVNTANAVISYPRNEGNTRTGIVKFTVNYQYNPYVITSYAVLTQGTYVVRESKITYSPSTANVGYGAGIHTSPAPILESVDSLTIRNVSGDMNIISAELDASNGSIIINYGANNGDTQKSATISVRGTGVAGYVSATYTLYQGTYSYLVNPIWKTTVVEVQGEPYVDYTISTEGSVIYSGRAYQLPDEDMISFELNEVVRDYVDNTLWWRAGYQTPSGWQRTFNLAMSNGAGGDYIFTKDWSYVEKNYSSSPFICLNEPIIDEIPDGCFVPVCVFSPQRAGDVSFVYTNTQGNTPLAYGAHLDNPRQARYLFLSTPGYKYGFVGGGVSKPAIYKGVAGCENRYVIYYENSYGGIDALPVQGNATASDKITAYTTKNGVRVPSIKFSYRRYLNEITKTWEFKTGFLSDLQASRMHHLIESTLVYVYDRIADEVYPAVIDETSFTYKTYKNQGRKFFNYSFKVQESQRKLRK